MSLLNFKGVFILLVCCFMSSQTFSQESGSVSIDNLTITTRNIQDMSELVPLAPSDTGYVEPKIEVSISFSVSDVNNLKSIEILFEKQKGLKDLKTFRLDKVTADGQTFLSYNKKKYPISGSQVLITESVPSIVLKRKIFFSVKAVDNENLISNILRKEFN